MNILITKQTQKDMPASATGADEDSSREKAADTSKESAFFGAESGTKLADSSPLPPETSSTDQLPGVAKDEIVDEAKLEKARRDRARISPKLPSDILRKKSGLDGRDGDGDGSRSTEAKSGVGKKGKRSESSGTIQKLKSRFSKRKKKKSKEAHLAMHQESNGDSLEKAKTDAKSKNRVSKKTEAPKVNVTDNSVLYLGIDLGTSQTTISASNGICKTVSSVVGRPKDVISQKLLNKEILFGNEALKNRLSLNLYRPLEKGVIKDTDDDIEAARELIKHVIDLTKPEKFKKVYAVIGAPARSSFANQQALIDAAREMVDAVMIISEPFAVAYGDSNIYNSLVIDIGAGTTNLCSLKGTMPEEEDQTTILKAGDHIDMQLVESIKSKMQGAQITKDMAKKWKEKFSFTMQSNAPAIVQITIEGKPVRVDISRNIKESCESIIPEVVTCARKIVSNFDPEFQSELKQNIVLAGGGSLIKNIDTYLASQLRSLGEIKITRVEDPIIAAAKGALALARDLTDDYWKAL